MATPTTTVVRALRAATGDVGPAVANVLAVAAATVEVMSSPSGRVEASETLRRVVASFELRPGVETRVAAAVLAFARDLDLPS